MRWIERGGWRDRACRCFRGAGRPMDQAAARRGQRYLSAKPLPAWTKAWLLGACIAHIWLLATSTALVRGLEVVQAWQHLCGGGVGFPLPSHVAVPGGCGLWDDWAARLCQPTPSSAAGYVYLVPVCVYLPCMCLRLYLSGGCAASLFFPFCSVSRERGGDFCFLIRARAISLPRL